MFIKLFKGDEVVTILTSSVESYSNSKDLKNEMFYFHLGSGDVVQIGNPTTGCEKLTTLHIERFLMDRGTMLEIVQGEDLNVSD